MLFIIFGIRPRFGTYFWTVIVVMYVAEICALGDMCFTRIYQIFFLAKSLALTLPCKPYKFNVKFIRCAASYSVK